MTFKSKWNTYTYRFPDGSEWVFRADKLDEDEEVIAGMTTKTIIGNVSAKDLRRAKKRGEDIEELVMRQIDQETLMSVKRATLLHMSVSWTGPEFTIPIGFKDAEGIVHTGGDTAPITSEWIGARDADENAEVLRALEAVWAGRTPEAQEDFPGIGERMDIDRGAERSSEKEVPLPV